MKKLKGFGSFKEKKVIYTAQCPKQKVLYWRTTFRALLIQLKNSAVNTNLQNTFMKIIVKMFNLMSLHYKIAPKTQMRKDVMKKNEFAGIKLQHVLNNDVGDWAKKYTISTSSLTNSVMSFEIMFTCY